MADTLTVKLALARGVGAISRLRGGGGTSAPGKLLMRLAPDAIAELGGRLTRGSVLISATNGKTTTAAMAAGILERAGVALVHNQAGANMAGGIATTLLDAARPHGAIAGELGLFEVDELWLAQLASTARDPARQLVPRPARPLRRARHDRGALGRGARAERGRRRGGRRGRAQARAERR
jgi:UDP-N-acetylmuramyl tripeptide synthase